MANKPEIQSDRIVFTAVLRKGVPTVPKWMREEANRICKLANRSVKDFGGNFEEVWFWFNEELTEEETEQLLAQM